MKTQLLIISLFISLPIYAQNMSGEELLDKTIAYHDPNGKWTTLAASLNFAPEERDGKTINRTVAFDNAGEYFRYYKNDGENEINQLLNGDSCDFSLNKSSEISEENSKKHRLTCERVKWIRNYYVYLYGLPMKLKDEGTIVDEKVTTGDFMGTSYLKLRVTYDAAVGKDIWYFYINPDTYEMAAYQFFHDESKGDGEYITLEGMVEIEGIKIPKLRKWYTNKEDKFLGADDLASVETLK